MTLNYGLFINTVITFLIVAIAVFILIRAMMHVQNRLTKPATAAPNTRECPQCCGTINIRATRCPNCTSSI